MTNPMESEPDPACGRSSPEDVNILYKWENDTEIWKVSNTVAPFSKHMLRQFIENQQRDIYETRQLRLIIESKADGKPVGAIDLFDLDPYNCRAGVGILIYDQRDQRQGYCLSCGVDRDPIRLSSAEPQPTVLRHSVAEHPKPRAIQKQGIFGDRT